jgi:hypothetical protein
MPVNTPNPGGYQGQISQAIVNVRNDMQTIINMNNYITSMGGVAFLTAAFPNGIGMAEADASATIAAIGNHAALAAIYQGGIPGPALDYRANGEPLWGGQ